MKKFVIALAAVLAVGTATAADLSSVGDKSVVATVASEFDVNSDVAYSATTVGAQLNVGALGSVALDVAGDEKLSTFAAALTYANAVSAGPVKLVGALSYSRLIEDGSNDAILGTVEGQLKVFGPFTGFASVSVDRALVDGASWDKSASAGTYVKLGKLTGKVGYNRAWLGAGVHDNSVSASLSYKF